MTRTRWCYAVGIALFVCGLELACRIPLLSPHDETTTTASTGDVAASGGSTVTQFTFQSAAGKAGWGASGLSLIALIASTVKSRRREQALDTVIEAIEDKQCDTCKRCIEKRNNAVVNRRVKKLTALKQNGKPS